MNGVDKHFSMRSLELRKREASAHRAGMIFSLVHFLLLGRWLRLKAMGDQIQ